MTNIESRLRSELSPPLPSPTDPEPDSHGWNQIERRVDRRHRAQRAGLGIAVLAVGTAVVAALATSNTANGRSAQRATDSIEALRTSPWSATVVGLAMVLAMAALGGAAVWAWGRQKGLGPVPTITAIGTGSLRPPWRIIGMIIMAAGLAYPMWTYVTHVRDVDQLVDRVPHLDGFETISAERSWNPFVGSHEPLVRVRLRPTPSGTTPTTLDPVQEAEKGLTAAGFNTTERLLNLYSRALVQSQERRWPSYEFAELNQEITGTVVVDYTLGGGNRDWLALTTYLGTIIVAIGALIATLGTAARQAAGGFALGATGLQAVLAIRALIRARSLIQDSGFTIGPLSSAHSWAAPTSLAHRELAQQVSNVAHDLYPLGAGALWILIIPWALGSFLTFLRRPGWIVGSIGVWVALATGVSVAFASIHSMLLAILE